MHTLLQAVYDECKFLIWPHVCASCKLFLRSDALLCSDCMRSITPIISVPVAVTATVTMQVYAIAAYQNTLKHLILAKGWHDERAAIVLGKLLWQATTLPHIPFDVIVPIPLHTRRYAQRGYNQAELMAQELSATSGKPLFLGLKRVRATALQSTLTVGARAQNLKDAFTLTDDAKEHLKGKRVLIVDDLMTSGATLIAAAKLINKCKPECIKGAVAGRVV